jgi:hypothetical protein
MLLILQCMRRRLWIPAQRILLLVEGDGLGVGVGIQGPVGRLLEVLERPRVMQRAKLLEHRRRLLHNVGAGVLQSTESSLERSQAGKAPRCPIVEGVTLAIPKLRLSASLPSCRKSVLITSLSDSALCGDTCSLAWDRPCDSAAKDHHDSSEHDP